MSLHATDIIPDLYDESGSDENDVDNEDHVNDLKYDVFNLLACDNHALRIENDNLEEVLCDATQRATQLLVQKLFSCTSQPSEVGPVIVLPKQIFTFPREKRIPEPKAETRWERFARDKGIKNKKKERMVFDEVAEEYRPRYGYKRANSGIDDQPIVEVKKGQDPFADPWAEARTEKKKRVEKNEKQRNKNIERITLKGKKRPPLNAKYDVSSVPGIPLEIVKEKSKRGKEGLRKTLQLVQHSTASMGRFDKMREGEPVRKIKGKKRSFQDNVGSDTIENEKKKMKAQLRIVKDKVDKKASGVTNSLARYAGILPDAPSDAFRQKKGKGKKSSRAE